MIAFAYYLLKMFVCSGLLFCYYQLSLRNKLFHQWNRFYLLAAVVLSLVIPCIQLNIWSAENESSSNIKFLRVVYSADNYVAGVTASRTVFSTDQWLFILYGLFSAAVLVIFILALIKIYVIIRSNSVMTIDDIKFVNTEEKNAPFSFLNYVFWNRQIDLKSSSGEHIFQHELVHVREKHSWDTLFLQLILAAFWCNPFFWLIKKELRMIHEFIADKKSVGQSDAHAFATMILHTIYPQHYTHLTNQFFHQSIKRRLAMLTKSNNPKLSYFSRVLALPLVAVLVLAFTIKQKNNTAKDVSTVNIPLVIDTVAVKQPTAFRAYRDKSIQWVYNDSVGKKIPWKAAEKMGFVVKEEEFQKNFNGGAKQYIESKLKLPASQLFADTAVDDNPLIVMDGKELGKKNSINLNHIISVDKVESIDILKGQSAIAKYGEKGKDGVIEIRTKNAVEAETLREVITKKTTDAETLLSKVIIRGRQTVSGEKPLIIIDGKESDDELVKMQSDNIQSMTVLKGETAKSLYGPKASNGAIIITTKTAANDITIKNVILDNSAEKKDAQTDLSEVVVVGYGKRADDPNKIFVKMEKEAEFPGGKEAWGRFLDKNCNVTVPSDKGAPTGSYSVELQFIVHLDGSISDIKALTKHGYGMEEEAIRTLRRGPKWIPAEQNGHKVASYKKITLTFVVADV